MRLSQQKSPAPPRRRAGSLLLATLLAVTVGLAGAPSADAGPLARAEQGASAQAGAALVPRPAVVEQDPAAHPFVLQPALSVVAAGAASGVGHQLATQLRNATGFPVPVRTADGDGSIRVTVNPMASYTVGGAAPTAESYVLDVNGRGASITARTAHGAFNGVQTLRQLLPAWADSPTPVVTTWRVSAAHIEDAPRFSYRGVMLDVARSFQKVDEVKRYIDTLSRLKMSVLHLHLADDQGWRIEITNEGKTPGDPIDYSALHRVSGTTAMNQRGYRNELGRTGYYTQEQYREIVAYARDRFVTVVPEVDIPGHTSAALHAIPQLNTARSLPARDPRSGVADWNGTADVGYSALDERLDLTYTFVEHVFGQLARMTGGPYVHIGGDESHAMGHTRYVDFVNRVVPRVKAATGVGTMGWNEYAEAGLSQGAGYWNGSVLQYWAGSGDWVRDFVAKGGKAVVSAANGAYLDQKYAPETPIGLSWACRNTCDFPQYYNWDPTSTVSGGIPEASVLGVEAPLWSETVRGGDQAEFLTLPRAAATLEIGWTPQALKDTTSFSERLARLGPRLTVAGTNFYESPGTRWAATVAGTHTDVPPGVTAKHGIGLVAAPGTKTSADGTGIVPDTVTNDGDPVSSSALTAPLTATATCADRQLPVTFTQNQARDVLHGAGLYKATVSTSFTGNTTCVLTPSVGDPVTVQVRATGTTAETTTAGTPVLSVPANVKAGTWVPLSLAGFAAGYVDIRVENRTVYTVRAGADGRFNGHGVVPSETIQGTGTISAVQGGRTASATVSVNSTAGPIKSALGKCVDVQNAATAAGTPVQLHTCNGTPAQTWNWVGDSSARAFDKCMDARNGGTANGTPIQIYTCNGTQAQAWEYRSETHTLRNVKSGRCLDTEGRGTADGTRLILWDCHDGSNQKWARTG
ncbi:family 20 glycosylhydrolase [Streptomyces bobili]|uniref:family 20 glycosylhydrolase n=1 Tax=Streptomyces bobili TaxID=67280 RepID=UPI0033C2E535